MQVIVSKAQALEKKMVAADGSLHSNEQQLRKSLLEGDFCHHYRFPSVDEANNVWWALSPAPEAVHCALQASCAAGA